MVAQGEKSASAVSLAPIDHHLATRMDALRAAVAAQQEASRAIRSLMRDAATWSRAARTAVDQARPVSPRAPVGVSRRLPLEDALVALAANVHRSQRLLREGHTAVGTARALRAGSFDRRIVESWRRRVSGGAPGPDEELPARQVRTRLEAGALPRVDGRVEARSGTGRPCVVCDGAIGERHIEYEPQESGHVAAH
jgi:hypothetical protein